MDRSLEGQRSSFPLRWLDRATDPLDERPHRAAAIVVLLALGLCYGLSLASGGAGVVASAWVVPIVLAAIALRRSAALGVALLAAVLAGPLSPVAGSADAAGRLVLWAGRGLAFLFVAFAVAELVERIRVHRMRELRLAEQERELVSRQAAVITTVSHEFRTPITIIGGMARTLEIRGMVTPEGVPLLAGITDATRRLTDLVTTVSAVLDDAGDETFLRLEPIILCELMSSVLLNVAIRDARNRVAVDIASGAEVFVSDRELLAQLLRHVVDNAVRFSPADERVDVRARRGGGRLEVHVLDRGPGIDPSILRSLAPFLQGDQSSTRTRGGLGLGLFAASRLAAVLGGSISFHARPGGGTAAVVTVDAPDFATPSLIAIRDARPQIFAAARVAARRPPAS